MIRVVGSAPGARALAFAFIFGSAGRGAVACGFIRIARPHLARHHAGLRSSRYSIGSRIRIAHRRKPESHWQGRCPFFADCQIAQASWFSKSLSRGPARTIHAPCDDCTKCRVRQPPGSALQVLPRPLVDPRPASKPFAAPWRTRNRGRRPDAFASHVCRIASSRASKMVLVDRAPSTSARLPRKRTIRPLDPLVAPVTRRAPRAATTSARKANCR